VAPALYFTRAAAPYPRDDARPTYLKHIGIYAYALGDLLGYLALPPSPARADREARAAPVARERAADRRCDPARRSPWDRHTRAVRGVRRPVAGVGRGRRGPLRDVRRSRPVDACGTIGHAPITGHRGGLHPESMGPRGPAPCHARASSRGVGITDALQRAIVIPGDTPVGTQRGQRRDRDRDLRRSACSPTRALGRT
jgi:hypothetical protein